MSLQKSLFLHISLLFFVIVFGAFGYVLIEHWTFFDGLYMTIITLTTIGFGEVHALDTAGRIFTIFLIITGLGTITYTLGSISTYFFGQQVYSFLSNRHMQEKIKKLKHHFIVCGASEIGLAVVEEMMVEQIPVLLIDQDQQKVMKAIKELKCHGLVGDATHESILEEANIEKASGLVATFGNDHENVYLIMSARQLNPALKIYAKVKDEQTTSKLLRAGADQIINPYKIGGMRLASLILRPQVVKLMDELAKDPKKLRIEELIVDKKSKLLGKALTIESVEKMLKVRVIAYKKVGTKSYQYLFSHQPIHFSEEDSLFFVQAKVK